jgi:hypothetical protein
VTVQEERRTDDVKRRQKRDRAAPRIDTEVAQYRRKHREAKRAQAIAEQEPESESGPGRPLMQIPSPDAGEKTCERRKRHGDLRDRIELNE